MIRRTAALATLLCSAAAFAASPLPEFPKDGVAVSGVPDSYAELRTFLRTFESAVGAKYHVAVVAFTDPQDREGPEYGEGKDGAFPYTDRLADAWGPHVDPQHSVVILLSLRNRDITAHPFARWTNLGWEQGEIKTTIDGSSFATWARSGAYAFALQQLIEDIDLALAARVAQEGQLEARARQRLLTVSANLEAFAGLVKEFGREVPGARQLHDLARSKAEEAGRALERGQVGPALRLADDAVETAVEANDRVREATKLQAEGLGRAPKVKVRLDELRGRIDASGLEADQAHAALAEADAHLAAAQEHLSKQEALKARERLDDASVAATRADSELHAAQRTHTFLTTTVPALVAGLLALAATLFLLSLRRRTALLRAEAEGVLDEWSKLLRTAGDNVVQLLDAHALILGQRDLVQRFGGESAAPVLAVAHEVDELLLSYQCGQRRLEEAQRAFAVQGVSAPFRPGPFQKVLSLLTVEEVVVRTEDVKERTLFVPARRELRVKPQALLLTMERSYNQAQHLVKELEWRFEAAWAAVEEARATAAALAAADEGLAAQLGGSAYQAEVAGLCARAAALDGGSQSDPLGAQRAAQALTPELAALRARIERARGAVRKVEEEAKARSRDAAALLKTLRADGLRVAEPGFDPDPQLAAVERTARQALRAVAEGREEDAVREAEEATEGAARLIKLLRRIRMSREQSAGKLPPLAARLTELRSRLPERKAKLEGLRQVHADGALRPALDNAEEAEPVLARAERCLAEASACLDGDGQRYLAAAELIDGAAGLLAEVEALYEEIETREAHLGQLLARAEQAARAARKKEAKLAELVAAGGGFTASLAVVDAQQQLSRALEEFDRGAAAARPDWVKLCALAEQLSSSATVVVRRAEAERAAFEEVRSLKETLPTRRSAYGALLAARDDDRPAANLQLRDSSAALDAALADASGERPDWLQLRSALKKAADGLELCKLLAEQDFKEAAEAREAIARADAAIKKAKRGYDHGVQADLGAAKAHVQQALQLIAAHQYTEAAATAHKALKDAKDAAQDAEDLVNTIEFARTRSETWGGGGSLLGGSSGWDSGSSFGSGSGSSFGSSSGGSSFGSSSGGSKW